MRSRNYDADSRSGRVVVALSDRLAEAWHVKRLDQSAIRADFMAKFFGLDHGVGGQSQDGQAHAVMRPFQRANAANGFEPVDDGHVQVHQDDVEGAIAAIQRGFDRIDGRAAITDGRYVMAEPFQIGARKQEVDLIVFSQQNPQGAKPDDRAVCRPRRRRSSPRSRRRRHAGSPAGSARPCRGEWV